MKKLRFFDSLKFVLATVACVFILNVAHADTSINSVIAYGKTEQSATPTPTNPVPIMTNNGVLKVNPNLFDINTVVVGKAVRAGNTSAELPLGSEMNNAQWSCSDYVRVQPNTTYTYTVPGSTNAGAAGMVFYSNKSVESAISGITQSSSLTRTFTTPANCNYVRFSWVNSAGNAAILVQGTSATGIYVDGMVETIRDSAGHTATAQMLLSVGDYQDEQNITTGAITRKVGVKVFDGTEDWALTSGNRAIVYCTLSDGLAGDYSTRMATPCTHLIGTDATNANMPQYSIKLSVTQAEPTVSKLWIKLDGNVIDLTTFKQYLADQYAAGTPVVVVYPLATETTENVTTQQMTTAPVRQTAGSILGMPIEVVLGDGTREWVSEMITIATTRYNEESFAPVKTDLSAAVNAVEYVVSNTMTQAQAIDTIATTKQTRPDESCPPFKKCLLVEDEDGTPHWYEIYDPINDFLNPILAAAALSGNQGAPTQTTHSDGSNTIIDTSNIFYNGSGAFRKKYIDNTTSAADRPFGPATGPDELPRCADNATRTTSTVFAGICYDTGGMFRTLTEGSDDDAGEWAIVYNGGEGGASLGITPGVVYGIAKCTTVGQHTTQMTGDVQSGSEYWWPKKLTGYSGGGTTLASLIEQYPNSNVENVFNTLPSEYGTDEKPGYPRDNFINCWCKMTAIGVPGSGDTPDQRYANGTIMSVSGGWVFVNARTSATNCANSCASVCAYDVRADATFRRNVLTVR